MSVNLPPSFGQPRGQSAKVGTLDVCQACRGEREYRFRARRNVYILAIVSSQKGNDLGLETASAPLCVQGDFSTQGARESDGPTNLSRLANAC